MALTTVNFKITFNVVNHTFKITDTTDFAGQGIGSLAGYSAAITASDPMGNAYATTIADLNASLISGNITPVTDSNGDFVLGSYNIVYTVTNGSVTVSKTKAFDLDYTSPEVAISMTFDETLPLLTSQDDTSYVVNGITPTITRTHSILFPPSLSIADYTVSTALLETSSNLYTLAGSGYQYTGYISSVLSYQMDTDFFITDTIEGEELINVFADTSLCAVYCAIKSLWSRYQTAKCESKAKADVLLDKLYKVTMNASLMRQALLCGKNTDVTGYYTQIIEISESTGDCSCGDNEPILITGLGGGGSGTDTVSVVVNSDGALTITPVTVGATTTYTVNLSAANLAKLTALRNVTLVAGAGMSLDTSTDGSGNITYTINNVSQAVTNNYMAFDIEIDNTLADQIPTINVVNVTTSGTKFTGAPSAAIRVITDPTSFLGPYGSTLSPTDQQFIDGRVKLDITNIFNTTPSDYPKIFTGVKRAFSNRTGISSNPYNVLDDTPNINILSNRFSVESYYNESVDDDFISLGINYRNVNSVTMEATGHIFYKYSTQGNSPEAKPHIFLTISVYILL